MDYPGINYVLRSMEPATKTMNYGTGKCSINKQINNHNYTFRLTFQQDMFTKL